MLSTLNQLLETAFIGKLFNINQNCPPEKNLNIDLVYNSDIDRYTFDEWNKRIRQLVYKLKNENTKLTVKSVEFITVTKRIKIYTVIQIGFEEYSEFLLKYDMDKDLFFEDKNH